METGQPAGGTRLDGRTRLLDTAEELLDRHGIDGVSVRTVTKAAGHRNSSAVNYHFGNRDQLIQAVFDRRQAVVEARRAVLLEQMEADGELTPRDAVMVAIAPLVDLLDDECGRRYLRLVHQAANHPDYHQRSVTEFSPSITRAAVVLMPLIEHVPADQRAHRLRLALGITLTALSDQARMIDTTSPTRPVLSRTVVTDDLVRVILAVLAA
jgi:AcrR family transcriptional regulator